MQIVIFRLNEEQFAVETVGVQSITHMVEVTKVPKAPKFIKGLINLRGDIISLINLNLLLNIENLDEKQNNIIIISINDEFVGMAVDEVYEVLDIDECLIENISKDDQKGYIRGIINFKNRRVTLIDIDKLNLN